MKTFVTGTILLIAAQVAIAQPLSGSFTVGGVTPDFTTLQDAANALKRRGVSGPTFFNIRPGTYTRNGGNNTVLLLDSLVAGQSETNRITFQPDQASERWGKLDRAQWGFDKLECSSYFKEQGKFAGRNGYRNL
jgi:hypothetical protein